MAAGLTATIAPSATFSLVVDAVRVEGEYVAGAKSGILTVPMSQGFSPVLACAIDLTDLQEHPIDSSYAAFYICDSRCRQ
ncbi:hypothetical protein [Variovorax sp. YR216]|uniref:hypothetical protein n=1 Tax=Variovorax sp. YR216 TaxID=1882828 RepID=UPI00089ACA23|nr:hypothetical protein [Variovorax sp. YR216]SEB22448.1 hypothetical protein SAMN05444680_11647 [Variovorax sp. YR216]